MNFDYGTMRRWRKKKGLSQTDLAKALDVSTATISRCELGLSPISASLLARLASHFGENIDEAFYRTIAEAEPGGDNENSERNDNHE